jgi:predicted RNA-binding Zn-ribbon protein involved in translation (DUF1610 family)
MTDDTEPQDVLRDIAEWVGRPTDPLIIREPWLERVRYGVSRLGDYEHMAVCHRCGLLAGGRQGHGSHISRLQTCGCEPYSEERWPGHDFNLDVELCYCCGQVLLNSGSRYSVWFCPDCKTLVGQLNGSVRRYAIPIGRHSFHGGFMLDGGSTSLDIALFTTSWGNVIQAMHAVDAWAGTVVRRILAERWPPGDRDVALLPYLRRGDPSVAEKEGRFAAMLEFLQDWKPAEPQS